MALARCPKCEAIIDSNDVYCRYCGCKIKEEPKDAKVDSFDAASSTSKKENITTSSTSFANKKPYAASTSSSNHLTSTEKSYHPYQNKHPYGYDEDKLGRIRLGYVFSFILVIILGILGAYLISTSLVNKIDYKIDSTIMTIGICVCVVAFVIFIITLVKLVKSYEDPVGTCNSEEVSNIDVEDVVDAGFDLLDIIINK